MEFDSRNNYYLCIQSVVVCEKDYSDGNWDEIFVKMDFGDIIEEEILESESEQCERFNYWHWKQSEPYCGMLLCDTPWINNKMYFRLMTETDKKTDKIAHKYGI